MGRDRKIDVFFFLMFFGLNKNGKMFFLKKMFFGLKKMERTWKGRSTSRFPKPELIALGLLSLISRGFSEIAACPC